MPLIPSGSDRLRVINDSPGMIIFLVILFLAAVKIPAALNSDIQPWDEGMYAARVNSININGDFLDQSLHSVGQFYSGSHPPLLIWTGFFTSMIFGFSPVTLKLLMLAISLAAVFILYRIGKEHFSVSAGILAALIFSGNILFNVFSKRFQLDMPYLLFMLVSFYFIMRMTGGTKMRNAFIAGIFFGMCLMSKILVGLFIPIVLIAALFLIREKTPFGFAEVALVIVTGLALALPWHIYMIVKHGTAFTDYFFGFHLIDRAVTGVELNQKASGPFYYFNYFLSIVPFGILLLFAFLRDFRNLKSLKFSSLIMWIWTICGFIIISVFKTKLESYLLLVLPAVSILIASYVSEAGKENAFRKTILLTLIALNLLWYATEDLRPMLKKFASENDVMIPVLIVLSITVVIVLLAFSLQRKLNIQSALGLMIILTFIISNVSYFVNKPLWEDRFRIKEAQSVISRSGAGKIVYVGTDYRYNPQFSYYFNGIDLGWKQPEYEFEMMDTNIGTEKIKARLELLNRNTMIMVERDKINRAEYPPAGQFIPDGFSLLHKSTGYEIYRRDND